MRNIMLVIEYDGTRFCGWQVQPNGISVQQVIEEAIFDLTGEKLRINGSGRTDSGVHALGQTANFMTDSDIPVKSFAKALNYRLPDDISIISSYEVHNEFHARFSTKGKHYRYKILNRGIASPFYLNKAHRIGRELDIDLMREAAEHFVGSHDFSGFMASGSSVTETVRTIGEVSIDHTGDLISIDIYGNGFLYNMVRIIAGTLVECGLGKIKPEDIPGIIRSCNRENAGTTLPACGLYLVEVFYGAI